MGLTTRLSCLLRTAASAARSGQTLLPLSKDPLVPLVVLQRRQAVADETPVERVQQDDHRRPWRPARGAGGARGHRVRSEASGSGLVSHAHGEIEEHGHHLVITAVQERPVRAENRCCRTRVRLASELGSATSSRTRLSRVSQSLPLHDFSATRKVDLGLKRSATRSR